MAALIGPMASLDYDVLASVSNFVSRSHHSCIISPAFDTVDQTPPFSAGISHLNGIELLDEEQGLLP